MGRFVGGDLALTMGTFGGVYIAERYCPALSGIFKASGFRGGTKIKAALNYVHGIPVYLIVHDNLAC